MPNNINNYIKVNPKIQRQTKYKISANSENIKLDKLTADEASFLVEPITEKEIKDTIVKLKNNKSPGIDGFAGLLCVNYKILTSILATRVQKYIKKLIKPDQTGFISGRHGTNNIRRVLNLKSLMAKNTQTSMLLSLDAEKAFDRVNWQFLEQTLINMGFDEKCICWFRLLYKNPKSNIRVNGHCSDFFDIERGVRQGDSLSPIFFALSIEPLAEVIRQDVQIEGIEDGGARVHKISLF